MKILKKLTTPFKKLFAHIPQTLPIGRTEFERFCVEIFDLYNLPDNRSYRNLIAVMILQRQREGHKAAKYSFFSEIRSAQAGEVAQFMMKEYRRELDEERQASLTVKDVTPLSNGHSVVESVSG